MSFENKLKIILEKILEVYKIEDDYINIIKDNITLRVKYYKDIVPDFKDETLYINDSKDIGDFFLNRLLNNIRSFKYNYVFNSNNSINKEYNYETQTLTISTYNTIKEVVKSKIKNRVDNVEDEVIDKSIKKTIAHEFGHALCVNFKGKEGYDDTKHNQLIKILNEQYPDIFVIPNTEGKLELLNNGIVPVIIEDEYSKMRKYYNHKESCLLLDDIFEEDEALQIYKINTIQNNYYFNKKYYKNIYNFESFNFKITSYARAIKLVMGRNKTFRTMYKDSIEFYSFFDSFKHICTKVFKEDRVTTEPTVSCILTTLEQAKKNDLSASLKLDTFFAECMKVKVNYRIKQNISKNDYDTLFNEVKELKNNTIKNDYSRLYHDITFDQIKSIINSHVKNI